MKIVSQVSTQQEFDEMKTILEVFVVNNRVRQLAELAIILNLSSMNQ